jgi:hypothetical protein
MEYLSQPKKTVKYFTVNYAEWEIVNPQDLDETAIPSDVDIDDRTIRRQMFESLKEATDYAKMILKNHSEDGWLAYIEVNECVSTVVKKLK